MTPEGDRDRDIDSASVVNRAAGCQVAIQAGEKIENTHISVIAQRQAPPARTSPPPREPFVNRGKALDRFRALLAEQRAPLMVLVHGKSGVGTTELARFLAARSTRRFDGGTLYVDMDDFRRARADNETGLAVSIEAVFSRLLTQLHVHLSAIPSGRADRQAHYLTQTQQAPVLVVLENVDDPAQVEPFLPAAPGSAVIVVVRPGRVPRVKRQLVADHNAETFVVEALEEVHRRELLTAFVGPERIAVEPAAADRVLRMAASRLTVLRMIGGDLKANPELSLEQRVAEWSDAMDRGEGTAVDPAEGSALRVVLDRLDQELASICRLLALIPGPTFTAVIAAEAFAVPVETMAGRLDRLVGNDILVRRDERYEFVHGIRAAAEQLAQEEESPSDREDVVRRAVQAYLRRCIHADRCVMTDRELGFDPAEDLDDTPNPFIAENADDSAVAALEWLKREQVNLRFVQAVARNHGWHATHAKLAAALTALYLNTRDYPEWIESSTMGISAAEAAELPGVEVLLRLLLNRAYLDLAEIPKAKEQLDMATSIAERTGDRAMLASAREVAGRFWAKQADFDQAEPALVESIDLNERIDRRRGAALARFAYGEMLTRMGRVDEAVRQLNSALTTFEELKEPDVRMAARTMIAIGEAKFAGDDPEAARRWMERGINRLAGRNAEHYQALALERLAEVYDRLVAPRLRREALEAALAIYRAHQSPHTTRLERLRTE